MAERSADWLAQADRDLQVARHDLDGGYYEWTCFAAHRAAEMAVKGLFQYLHGAARGHALLRLLERLRASTRERPWTTMMPSRRSGRCTMRKRSWNSVEVWFLDGPKVIRYLRRRAKQLVREDPCVERVLLFGSLARGNYAPGSDADLCILLEGVEDPRRPVERAAQYHPPFEDAAVPVDILVYTRGEYRRMVDEGGPLAREIEQHSTVLAEKRIQRSQPLLRGT